MFKRSKAKLVLAVLSIFILSSAGLLNVNAAYTNSDWMGWISGSKSLTQLSIPGTHDSGALYEPIPGIAKCQNLTITQQLNAGVRYLDIRCRHINNEFAIHHGPIFQNMYFDDVLSACIGLLNQNPTECIIMAIKPEHTESNNTRTFEETFNAYMSQNPDKWYTSSNIPILGLARGKIVLVRRFPAATLPKGIDATGWADNTTFVINCGLNNIKIQDQYVVPDNAQKWALVQNMYNEAKSQNPTWLYINFTSGYKKLFGLIPSITTVSNYMNPKIEAWLTSNTEGRFGITVMDFANQNRCSLIIKTNFADK